MADRSEPKSIEKPRAHHKEAHGRGDGDEINENTPIDEVKAPGLLQRAREEIEAIVEAVISKGDEINEDTPIDEVKAPGLLQRAKEEIEAIVEAATSKKHKDGRKEKA